VRLSILIIAGIELLLVVVGLLKFWLGGAKSDLAGQGMALAYAVIGAMAALLLLVPAWTLAYYNMLLWLALILAILASIFVLVVLVAE
jgi:hypothetical protein